MSSDSEIISETGPESSLGSEVPSKGLRRSSSYNMRPLLDKSFKVNSRSTSRKKTQIQRFDPSPAPSRRRKHRILPKGSGSGSNGGAATTTNTCTSAEQNTEVIMGRQTSSTPEMTLPNQGNDTICLPATSRENEPMNINGGLDFDLNTAPAMSDYMDCLDVSENLRSTCQSIFQKHGDIMRSCSFASSSLRTLVLGEICKVAKLLWEEGTSIKEDMLEAVISTIKDARNIGVNVDWLDLEARNTVKTQLAELTSNLGERSKKIDKMKLEIELKECKVEEILASIEKDKGDLDSEMRTKEELEKGISSLESIIQRLRQTDQTL